MLKKREKRGNILTENIIFIILNLAFIAIIVLFVSLKAGNSAVIEEVYAKQIALMIDAAKPDMIISFNVNEGIERLAKEKTKKVGELTKEEIEHIVNIQGNVVGVSLRNGKSYSYSFFNDVSVGNPYLDETKEELVFVISEKKIETSSISDESLLKIINYAKENIVENRKCNCNTECLNYARFISQSAGQNGINPVLVLSLMMQESSCDKNAESSSSIGLMQISLTNCNGYGLNSNSEECKTQLLDNSELNIDIGATILREKYDTYKLGQNFIGCNKEKFYSGWEAALRGYNGWGCDSNYPEQDNFVEEVTARYNILKEIK